MKRHIFIVDDILENLVVLSDLLEQEWTKITTASSGKEALKAIPIENPDIILLDLFMPEMDGFDVCRKLKADKKTAEIPVIFLTAGTDIENLEKGYDLGAIDYIMKPYNSKELIKRVNAHIELEKTRKLLKENLQVKESIITAFTDAIYICSSDYKITYLNDAMVDLIGYNAEGELCYKAIHKLNEKCSWCIYDKLKDKKEITYEFFDQQKKKYFISKNIILINTLQLSVFTDITERKLSEDAILDANISLEQKVAERTEQLNKFITKLLSEIKSHKQTLVSLKESENKYSSLFKNMLDSFALCKIVQNEKKQVIDYIFLEINKTFESQFGLKREQILNKKVTEVFPGIENDPADWIRTYGKVALTGKELRFEQFSETLQKWYSVLAFSPKKNYFATIFQDITDRKQAEQKIFNAIIETEEKEKEKIAANLHDELGPYLSALKLYIHQLIKKGLKPSQRLKLAQTLEITIDESIDKTKLISNSLMPNVLSDFGYIVALESFINKINLIHDIRINFIKPKVKKKISFTMEIILYRILIEMINNTIKHANANTIKIIIKNESKIKVIYSDDGIGFNLFEMLNKRKGNGLINIFHKLKSINAKNTYSSNANKGIVFNFEIPYFI